MEQTTPQQPTETDGAWKPRSKVEEVAATINIPSQPKVMQDINLEFNKEDIDFGKIGELIRRDVSLSAKIVKVANSPLFRRRKSIESIDHALLILGRIQFQQTILASALRQTLEGHGREMDQFWAHSESMGLICDVIARQFQPDLAGYAYMVGLFHDCAVPILMDRSSEYNTLVPRVLARDRLVSNEEEVVGEIDHASLGMAMTRSWSVPIPITKAVMAHHSDDFLVHDDPTTTRLHVILAIAENYYLYSRRAENEIFQPVTPNPWLLTAIEVATGWSKHRIDGLSAVLDKRFSDI